LTGGSLELVFIFCPEVALNRRAFKGGFIYSVRSSKFCTSTPSPSGKRLNEGHLKPNFELRTLYMAFIDVNLRNILLVSPAGGMPYL
jgi:hypothetical protein